jgi:hypothetical protein
MFLKQQFAEFEDAIGGAFTAALAEAGMRRTDAYLFLAQKSSRTGQFVADFSARMPPGAVHISWNGIASLWACAQAVARLSRRLFEARRARKDLVDVASDPEIRIGLDLYELSRRLAKSEFTNWVHWAPPVEWNTASPDTSFGNRLFLGSIGWIIRHELAHLALDHHYKVNQHEIPELAAEEEADAQATDWLKGHYKVDEIRLPGDKPGKEELVLEMRAVVAGVGLLWIALFEESFRIRDKAHPPPAERFMSCFDRFRLAEDSFAAQVFGDCVKTLVDPQGDWGRPPSAEEATAKASLVRSLIHLHRYLNEITH